MSGEEKENLATLTSLLGRYQNNPKKTLTLRKKEEPKSEPEPEPEPEPQSDPQPDPNVNSENESDAESEDEVKPNSTPEKEKENEEISVQDSEFGSFEFPDELPDFQLNNITTYSQSATPTATPVFRAVHKSVPRDNRQIGHLTVVTYNMWFSEKDFVNRIHHLMRVLLQGHKYLPDLVCFQEVTQAAYQLLQQGIGSQYYLFEIFGDPPVRYTNLIAINKETMELDADSVAYYDLPETQMSRKLMTCQVTIKKTKMTFHVMNTHLESLDTNWKNRQIQLEAIEQILEQEKIENFILCGDFNICHDNEPAENQIKNSKYHDAWIEMGSPQSLKYTYDCENNPYINIKTKFRSRLDRILYRFNNPTNTDRNLVVITKLKLLGIKEPFPSDHFGVLAEFLIKTGRKVNV